MSGWSVGMLGNGIVLEAVGRQFQGKRAVGEVRRLLEREGWVQGTASVSEDGCRGGTVSHRRGAGRADWFEIGESDIRCGRVGEWPLRSCCCSPGPLLGARGQPGHTELDFWIEGTQCSLGGAEAEAGGQGQEPGAGWVLGEDRYLHAFIPRLWKCGSVDQRRWRLKAD